MGSLVVLAFGIVSFWTAVMCLLISRDPWVQPALEARGLGFAYIVFALLSVGVGATVSSLYKKVASPVGGKVRGIVGRYWGYLPLPGMRRSGKATPADSPSGVIDPQSDILL